MLVYHYTTAKAWAAMRDGSDHSITPVFHHYDLSNIFASQADMVRIGKRLSESKYPAYIDCEKTRGLWPNERFAPFSSISDDEGRAEANLPGVWGLTDALPKIWNDNSVIPRSLNRLFEKIVDYREKSLVLLSVDVNEKDRAYVCDWALKNYSEEKGETAGMGHTRYFANRVPLMSYSENKGFLCPEVVILNPIPLTRIKPVFEINNLADTDGYVLSGDEIALHVQKTLAPLVPEK